MKQRAEHLSDLRLKRLEERGERLYYELLERGLHRDAAGQIASEWQQRAERRPIYLHAVTKRARKLLEPL